MTPCDLFRYVESYGVPVGSIPVVGIDWKPVSRKIRKLVSNATLVCAGKLVCGLFWKLVSTHARLPATVMSSVERVYSQTGFQRVELKDPRSCSFSTTVYGDSNPAVYRVLKDSSRVDSVLQCTAASF